ncbi:hypothetical protein HMPREF3213_00468 [Heyndrickxia coagulans]|uniref:Uncharacterized protein n=1 Tax=Heyndrickxia coagulans TaxID=1398 RepID=A0A133L0E1_HEYCO|nr:hypothetical protein HMPREF3213_00468 [Heyndrickxia coagulans]
MPILHTEKNFKLYHIPFLSQKFVKITREKLIFCPKKGGDF